METNENTQNPEIPELIPAPVYSQGSTPGFHKLKYMALGVLILFAGLAGGFYFGQNTSKAPVVIESYAPNTPIPTPESDEMAGWEMYGNEEYGFEFRYPSGYFIEESKSIGLEIVTVKNNNLLDKGRVKPGTTELFSNQFYITFGLYEQNISPDDQLGNWLKTNDLFISPMSGPPLSTKDVFVNGYRGLQLEYAGTGKYFVFTNDRKVFFAYYGPYDSEYGSVFEQILSTFEFTNPQ